MAEDSGQEKTHEPSQKRLDDARKKGQLPRSRDLTTAVVSIGSALGLWVFGGHMLEHLGRIFHAFMSPSRQQIMEPALMLPALTDAIFQTGFVLLPFMMLTLTLALCAPMLIGGWNFSTEALQPKFSKMSPIQGVKRLFGPQGLMELFKSIAKVLLIGSAAAMLMLWFWEKIFMLARMPLEPAMTAAGSMFFWTLLLLSSTLSVVAAIDVPFQIWNTKRELKMTEQELRDEMKETEGKPEVKGRIRQLQREMAQRRMMEAVPEADVIVTNPTHFAVALKYDQLTMRAPKIVALGVDNVALKIREIANAHQVPIYEEPPLARVLYHTGHLGQEVPAPLYLAVAQVLAYTYQLRAAMKRRAKRPVRPHTLIPDEYQKFTTLNPEVEDVE